MVRCSTAGFPGCLIPSLLSARPLTAQGFWMTQRFLLIIRADTAAECASFVDPALTYVMVFRGEAPVGYCATRIVAGLTFIPRGLRERRHPPFREEPTMTILARLLRATVRPPYVPCSSTASRSPLGRGTSNEMYSCRTSSPYTAGWLPRSSRLVQPTHGGIHGLHHLVCRPL